MRALLFVAVSVILVSLWSSAGAEMRPTPGQLVVFNQQALNAAGDCQGAVHMYYGLLPEQATRAFQTTTAPDCSVEVAKVTFPDSPRWRPAGPQTVSMLATVETCNSLGECVSATLNHQVKLNYPITTCSPLTPIEFTSQRVDESGRDAEHYAFETGFHEVAPSACELHIGARWDPTTFSEWWERIDLIGDATTTSIGAHHGGDHPNTRIVSFNYAPGGATIPDDEDRPVGIALGEVAPGVSQAFDVGMS